MRQIDLVHKAREEMGGMRNLSLSNDYRLFISLPWAPESSLSNGVNILQYCFKKQIRINEHVITKVIYHTALQSLPYLFLLLDAALIPR